MTRGLYPEYIRHYLKDKHSTCKVDKGFQQIFVQKLIVNNHMKIFSKVLYVEGIINSNHNGTVTHTHFCGCNQNSG